jgi:hypothetical protein
MEIIVVDNASTNGTAALISHQFPNIKIIRSNRNVGAAGGFNLGIKHAKGTYLILLNDDTIVESNFIYRLVEAMESEPRAALGSCKIYMIRGKIIQYAGGYINKRGYPIMRGCGEEDKDQYNRIEEVDWASSACMIIRKKCIEEIGLFDNSYYIYYDDTDLSLRAKEVGYKVIYIPMAIIRHYGSATSHKYRRFRVFSIRNRFRFLLKHFGSMYTAKAIAWDFIHVTPQKVPYLLVAIIWNYPLLLEAMLRSSYRRIRLILSTLFIRCVRYLLYYWRVAIKTFLKILVGKNCFFRLLNHNVKINLLFYPFFIVRVSNNIVQTKIRGNTILQPIDNLFLNEEINFSEVYDHFYKINEDDIIIDIGAHVGFFALRAARKARKGFILAIEPHPFNYQLLTKNIKANNISNIRALRLALWSSDGVMKLYLAGSSSHSLKSFQKNIKNYIEVQTKTLDTVIKEFGIQRVNLIKIDVEGAELEVLRGAQRTLMENDSFLSIAAYHTKTEVKIISEYLRKKGFRTFVYESGYLYGFKEKGNISTILRNDLKMKTSDNSS